VGALLASLDRRPDAELAVTIDQGVEMGRPSRLEVTAVRRGGQVADVRVAGSCVPVMQGTFSL
jgi:trans-2,3-dihydro-3-hydroxyanthranilate isomerase